MMMDKITLHISHSIYFARSSAEIRSETAPEKAIFSQQNYNHVGGRFGIFAHPSIT